jgi:hypothetical protein
MLPAPADKEARTMPSHPSPLHARRHRVARYLVGIAAVPLLVGVLAPLASAQSDPAPHAPPPLTDAQKACLSQHGVTVPSPGQPLSPPTDAQRAAFRAAAQACGLPAPQGFVMLHLTDAQKSCLAQHGVSVPAPGQKLNGPPTDAQRAAFEAAAQACGLPKPSGRMLQLTDAQKSCLSQHGVSVPAPGQKLDGPPTDAQRAAFEAAAQACGLPTPKDLPPSSS